MARTVWERRSVKRDVKRFDGWSVLIGQAYTLHEPRYRALYAATFLTGGRITEVLGLNREDFTIDDKYIQVSGMPLLKRYKKLEGFVEEVDELPRTTLARLYQYNESKGKWCRNRFKTEPIEETRIDFRIWREEILCPILLDWLNEIGQGRLFKGISRWMAYRKFKEIEVYPHWLRAQRASCLISFWRFTMDEMMEWMGWEELTTARQYAKMGPRLYEKFERVQVPPKMKELEKSFAGEESIN